MVQSKASTNQIEAASPPAQTIHSKRKNPHCEERCRVCEDHSTGYHYGIPSCNGCKSFFRRTLLEQRNFVCDRDGECTIRRKTRKGQKRHECRACRFQQCVEAGMNPNGIIVVEEEVREILQNAIKQQAMVQTKKLTSINEHMNRIVENLMYIESRHHLLRRSDFNPYPNDPQTIIDILQRCTTMGQPLQEMQGWPLEQTTTVAVMSLEEHAQLRIPLSRCAAPLPNSYKFWFYVDLVGALEWAKTLDFFRYLDLPDQRNLIIFSAWQIVNVTSSYFSYVNGFDKAVFPDGKFSIWSPREVDRDIIRPMLSLQIDRTEYVLLKTLIICNPSCETISERAREIVHREREKVSKVLFHHCMNTHGTGRGPSRFGEIVALESTLLHQALKSKHLQSLLVSLRLRPGKVVLMDEICEINHLS